ncbi:MAG: HEPN domain-containing protein [Deferrisomatales bacterium]|nr:HEPN domain-containing protein [Deferrisomatales bacterium]
MTPPPRPSGALHPGQWLAHARSDLTLAKLGLEGAVLPEQLCFHAQQAVEKAFKAILLHRQVDFPFTHDLSELLDTMAAAGIDVPPAFAEADALTPYAVETRYPGFWGEVSEREVAEALRLAEAVVRWAEEAVGCQPRTG